MNQNPEQLARDNIDKQLIACGWIIQGKSKINLSAGLGVVIREYQTDIGPADYVFFVNKLAVGILEAKRAEEGVHLTMHEEQTEGYRTAKLKYLNNLPLFFGYESTGEVTRFTDFRDPKPRSRPVFTFHRPETLLEYCKQDKSLRTRIQDIPALPEVGLRDCQIKAINKLEQSFKDAKPKALIQMATGSGKTFTAITFIYRLLKFAKAKRILFLVDTKNLGEQAEQEMMAYVPNDDNRKFTELYGVTRLKSSFIPADNQVYISTIQRMYAILKGTELDESAEEVNPNEIFTSKEPAPVTYIEKVPIEFFDFIVIDECHRSIYNLWKQVLDYFDVFQIGLTATPDNRTFGYFNQNLVSDYGYEKAVIDGVLVPYNVFTIETQITKEGSKILMGEKVDKRERLTRRKFWESVDEDIEYSGKQLDKDIVNKSQIRTIIRAIKENLPKMFPDRITQSAALAPSPLERAGGEVKQGEAFEVPKTLIFAKTDSHAEDIIEIVREEFAEENKFCKKITYKSVEDPKTVLSQFRNDYYPRIAVTVDMIATGTDIRPLEVLVFMRDVKSRSYYEQMKGRGTRTCSLEQLKATGTPSAKFTKDHFVIIDAIGVESSQKTDSRPLEKKPGMSLKDLLQNVAMGNVQEDILSTLANRLIRLDKQISEKEKTNFAEQANGHTISHVVKELLNAYDPDTISNLQLAINNENPGASPADTHLQFTIHHSRLVEDAVAVFNNPKLRSFIVDVRKKYDQVIDGINIDTITNIGWVKDQQAAAALTISNFTAWIQAHKDEITALQIFYGQPYRRRELTYKMIRDLYEKINTEQPLLSPLHVWRAYENLVVLSPSKESRSKGGRVFSGPRNELIALVSLIRKVTGIDESLTAYDKTVDKNF